MENKSDSVQGGPNLRGFGIISKRIQVTFKFIQQFI